MNPVTEQQLRLELNCSQLTPTCIALALKDQIKNAGLAHGEVIPATKDYAIANRLNRNLVIKAFGLLKAEGIIQINRQRRHELIWQP